MAAFTVQHLAYDVPSSGGTQTVTSVDTTKSVIINTANNFSAADNADADENSVGIDLNSATSVGYTRQGTALLTCQTHASLLEYTGAANGPNEFLIRGTGTVSITAGNRTTTATCSTTPTNIDNCVVFLSVTTSGAGAWFLDDKTGESWLSGTDTINFERGGSSGTTTFHYQVVEFVGSNWTIHHGFSGDVSTDTGSITLYDGQKGTGTTSTVTSWGKAFILGHFKADDSTGNTAIADLWPVYAPGTGTGTVDWTFDAGRDGTDNQHLVYVIENSDTNFTVARYNSGAITLPAGNHTQTITAVTSLTEAIVLNTCETSGGGNAHPRGARSSGFNSTTQAFAYCSISGNVGQIEYQVIDFNGMDEGSTALTALPGLISATATLYGPTLAPGSVTTTPARITSTATLYSPTLAPGQVSVTASLIDSTATVYSATVLAGQVTTSPVLIDSAATLYGPTVQPGSVTTSVSLIDSAATLYSPGVNTSVSVGVNLIDSAATLYGPSVLAGQVTAQAQLIDSASTVYSPTVAPGQVTTSPNLIDSAATVYSSSALAGAVTASPNLITATATLYNPAVLAGQVSIGPGLITATATLYDPTVAPGAVSISLNLIDSTATLYSPSLTIVTTIPTQLIDSTAVLYGPSIATGAATTNPGLIDITPTLYQPFVSAGASLAAPALINSAAVLYGPTIVAGQAELTPNLIDITPTLYNPSVQPGSVTLTANLIDSGAVLYTPLLIEGQSLTPNLIDSSATLYAPTIATGSVTVSVSLIDSAVTMYSPSLIQGQSIDLQLIDSAATLYSPGVSAGAGLVSPALIDSAAILYNPNVIARVPSENPIMFGANF